MLFAGALGSYFAYKLGVDAEMAEFENQARARRARFMRPRVHCVR